MIPTLFLLLLTGCPGPGGKGSELDRPEAINATIGTITDIIQSGVTEVRGYGIVAGLNGTGSSECPPDLRTKLIKQIKVEIKDRKGINPQAFINSKTTAVVEVRGTIPAITSQGDVFDLRVAPLANTQTTSLKGGRLFRTKLVRHEKFVDFKRYLETEAFAEGPIFINNLADRNPRIIGDYIIAGGRAVEGVRATMLLRKPNHYTAYLISKLINSKFDVGTAHAKSDKLIFINIPAKYRHEKQKFLAMVRLLYMGSDPVLKQKRINSLVMNMANDRDKLTPEIALEVTGNSALNEIAPLLSHPDEEVRLHAARCMLNIGDDRPLKTLQNIIENKNSPYRIEAIKAVGSGARRNDAIMILGNALNSEDFETSLAVYEEMRKLRSSNVNRSIVAGDFFLDTIRYRGENRIYVSRKGTPKIVIFGDQLQCAKNLYVESNDKDITINARYGDKYVSIWRKNPKKRGVIGPLQSTFSVKEVIKTLGELPIVPRELKKRPGLAIPYCEICELLEKMCKTGAINAKFIAGELTVFPNIDPTEPPQNIPGSNDKPTEENDLDNSEEWKTLLKDAGM